MDKKITRREFIKKTAATTTALGVGGIVGTSKALAQQMGGPTGQFGSPGAAVSRQEDKGP